MKKPPNRSDLAVAGADLEARRTQRVQTAATFSAGRTPLQVVEVAEHAAGLANRADATGAVCREGCAWCCHKVVGTSVPEVLRIAGYLRQQRTEEELQALVGWAQVLGERRRALAGDRWAAERLPCPLLASDRCSVYPVRPLTCRGYASRDADRCKQAVQSRAPVEVPVLAARLRLTTLILDGMRAGLAEVGLAGDLLHLTDALPIALSVPDAAERWLAGESVFAAARMP